MTSPSSPQPTANDSQIIEVQAQRQQEIVDYQRHSHTTILWGSLAVIVLSCMLSVRGEKEVIIPWINVPLPGACTTRRLLGIDCPGCGLTRSFVSLGHGNLPAAWHFNPVGILFFAFVAAQVPYQAWQLWRINRGMGVYDFGAWSAVPLLTIAGLLLLQWGWKLSSSWL